MPHWAPGDRTGTSKPRARTRPGRALRTAPAASGPAASGRLLPSGRRLANDATCRAMASLVLLLLGLALAVPLSCLPEPWRKRWHLERSLPLAAGTALSALIELGLIFSYFGHVYALNRDVLAGALPTIVLLLLFLLVFLDASVRLINAAALWTPLGTLPLWLIERGVHYSGAALRHRHRPPPSSLPRARLVRRKRPSARR